MENKTPTTRLEILQWMLNNPGQCTEGANDGPWVQCQASSEGMFYYRMESGNYRPIGNINIWRFRMLPESPPKRVPFDKIDKLLKKGWEDRKPSVIPEDITAFWKEVMREVVTEALEQMREELKK